MSTTRSGAALDLYLANWDVGEKERYWTIAIGGLLSLFSILLHFYVSFTEPGVLPNANIIQYCIRECGPQAVLPLFQKIYRPLFQPSDADSTNRNSQRSTSVGSEAAEDVESNGVNIQSPEFLESIINPDDAAFSAHNAKFCRTCKVWRPPKCSHCRDCNNCVLDFDHHCAVAAACIGSNNHRCFVWMCIWSCLTFVFVGTLSCVYFAEQVQSTPQLSQQNQNIVHGVCWGLGIPFLISVYLYTSRRRFRECWPIPLALAAGLFAFTIWLYASKIIAVHPMVVLMATCPWPFAGWAAGVGLWQMQLIGQQLNVKQRAAAMRLENLRESGTALQAARKKKKRSYCVRQLTRTPFRIAAVMKFLFTLPSRSPIPQLQRILRRTRRAQRRLKPAPQAIAPSTAASAPSRSIS
eukprot:Filipodium_phascolosomae@DN2112_c0_g1_i1.p1